MKKMKMQHRGFSSPLRRIFLVEGIFTLELTWVQTTCLCPSLPVEHRPSTTPAIALCSGLLLSFRTSWSPAVSALLQCLASNCCKAGNTCIPSHRLKRSRHSCPRQVNAGNKNTQHAPSTKTECDYLNGWIKKWSNTKNLTQNGEPQICSWGMQKKKKK